MMEHINYIVGLLARIAWVASPVILDAFQRVFMSANIDQALLSNESLRGMATNYSDSITIGLCLIVVIIGSLLGVFYPTPAYGSKPMPTWMKATVSVVAGILAFAYYIEQKKSISPAVCIWVAGVSFVAPAILHLLHAGAIKFVSRKLKITKADINRINKSFKDWE